jgi:hypothetical protein
MISYCTGDPKEVETIIVNGLTFNVFARLGHALRQARHFWKARHHSEELVLWADQVCINQSNTKERAHQVNFMGDIYSNAREVLISLSAEQDSPVGLGWLNMFSPTDPGSSSDELAGDDYCAHSTTDGGTIMGSNQAASQVRDFHFGWDAFIATVLRSPWWSRV